MGEALPVGGGTGIGARRKEGLSGSPSLQRALMRIAGVAYSDTYACTGMLIRGPADPGRALAAFRRSVAMTFLYEPYRRILQCWLSTVPRRDQTSPLIGKGDGYR